MVQNERPPAFVTVTCTCGRGLRAKAEQAGTEVRCWECHQMVLVPLPPQGQRVARELSDNALTVIQGPGLHLVFASAAVVTLALAVPTYGVWCSVLVLAIGASAYGEIIRRVSRGPTESPDPGWLNSLLPKSILKFVVGVFMAVGTVVPLWWLNSGLRQSPHWDAPGRTMAGLAWTVGPLLMLMICGRTEKDAPMGVRRVVRLLAGHPFATALALAVIPITLLLLELGLTLVFYLPGHLPFFALDYMPMPTTIGKPIMYNGIPHYQMRDYRDQPPSVFYQGHRDGLRQGYSFIGAIPASLSRPTSAGLDGEAMGLIPPLYPIVRFLLVLVITTCLLAAFAVQARWLGSIPSLERRKPRPGLEAG